MPRDALKQNINSLVARINVIARQFYAISNANEESESDKHRHTRQLKLVLEMMLAKHELQTLHRRFMSEVLLQKYGNGLTTSQKKAVILQTATLQVNAGNLLLSNEQISK